MTAASTAGRAELDLQVMWNRLIAIVEEQALTLVRTAFSTSVREAGDLSAGVFDRDGAMIAQAVTGTPGHVNTMAAAVVNFIEAIGEDRVADGDVYITNDPWLGTGHLHDITVVTPVFGPGTDADDDAGLIGWFGSTAHVVDIGGRGYGPDAASVYEEGLRIPIMRFVDRGRRNEDLVAMVRANVREPDSVIGDIHSLAAANETGRQRLLEMLREFDRNDLDDVAAFVFDRTGAAVAARLAEVPDGVYRNELTVDGYDTSGGDTGGGEADDVTLAVTITVEGERAHADFTGTSAVSPFGINVPIVYAHAYFTYAMVCALAPGMPNNAASLAPFTVSAPDGCILNARHPDPVSVRHVMGHFVTDLTLGAFADELPDTIPAEGAGALWNFQITATPEPGTTGRPTEILMFNSGGTGARPGLDGLSATAFPSGVRTMSVEATEQVGPVVFGRKELAPDSGGAGRFRGGLGQVIELGPAEGWRFVFSAMFDRVRNPARGRAGGDDGAAGTVALDDGSAFAAKGTQPVPPGRRVVLQLPGGGGHGDPAERAEAAQRHDLEQGYVTGADE